MWPCIIVAITISFPDAAAKPSPLPQTQPGLQKREDVDGWLVPGSSVVVLL